MSDPNRPDIPHSQSRWSLPSIVRRIQHAAGVIVHHGKHTGVGIVCAVAYFDPGNWGVDLQAGSQFGYALLFVVLLAGLFAVYLQVLASRLGCVTGIDLATHARLLLYNRPRHTLLYRWLGLYPLYILSEVAIVATDLAELLGSAIALCMLFPKLELWHGVLITAFDVVLILGMRDPLGGRPARMFELIIGAMVIAIIICMIVIISRVNVNWAHAFDGFIPSKTIFAQGGVYTSVGILGATVMPHSLFLGSALATQDRVSFYEDRDDKSLLSTKEREEALPVSRSTPKLSMRRLYRRLKDSLLDAFQRPPASAFSTVATRHSERQNNSYEFVLAHIHHGMFDMVGSLLGFALMINSLILMLASAVFFYGTGNGQANNGGPASLFDAYDLIRDLVGQSAATLFAIALLASGQSSSLIATVAGQAVCEGFLQWRVSAIMRRVFTRLLAIIPSMTVAIVLGKPGINVLLVASQVVLSVVLPFVVFPLLYLTSSKTHMSVRKTPPPPNNERPTSTLSQPLTFFELPSVSSISSLHWDRSATHITPISSESEVENVGEVVDFSNNKLVIGVGVLVWLIIVAANMYVIVQLGLGTGQ